MTTVIKCDKRSRSIKLEAIPMYDPRDNSIKRIRVIQSVNGKPTRAYIAHEMDEAKELIRAWYHLNRHYFVKVIWPFA